MEVRGQRWQRAGDHFPRVGGEGAAALKVSSLPRLSPTSLLILSTWQTMPSGPCVPTVPCSVDFLQVHEYVRRGYEFTFFQIKHNPHTWVHVQGCNLVTGEVGDAPAGWATQVSVAANTCSGWFARVYQWVHYNRRLVSMGAFRCAVLCTLPAKTDS